MCTHNKTHNLVSSMKFYLTRAVKSVKFMLLACRGMANNSLPGKDNENGSSEVMPGNRDIRIIRQT